MKGYLFGVALAALALAGLGTVGGCSSSSSGGGSSTPPGTYCDEMVGGSHICVGYTNLTADQANSLNNACTQGGGKTVSSCPSSGEVGCCAVTVSGYNENYCYYSCPAAGGENIYQMACSSMGSGAMWTAGSMSCGDGGTSSGGDGGSGSSSGSSSGGGDAATD